MYMRDKEEMKKTRQRVTSGPATMDRVSISTFWIQICTTTNPMEKINAERPALKPITHPAATHEIRRCIANSCAGYRGGALKRDVNLTPVFSLGLFSLLY